MGGILMSFTDVFRALAEQWSSASALRLSEAAAPFWKWLQTLVHKIYLTANETLQITEAYYGARRRTVRPQVIANIRAQIEQLAADNEFERNTPAIADLQRQYQKYWNDDVMAMRNYDAKVSQALSALTPWEPPPIITETGLTPQATAV